MTPVHWIGVFSGIMLGVAGCTQHRVEVQPIKVEPIYLTIDVNVRVDRELDDFFDYKQPPANGSPITEEPTAPPPAEPAAQPVHPSPSGATP